MDKLKGAAQVIQGFGENIRGSTLAAVDKMGNTETGDNKNEQIAAEGRARTQEGLANLRGSGTSLGGVGQGVAGTHGPGSATATGFGGGAGADEEQTYSGQGSYGSGTVSGASGGDDSVGTYDNQGAASAHGAGGATGVGWVGEQSYTGRGDGNAAERLSNELGVASSSQAKASQAGVAGGFGSGETGNTYASANDPTAFAGSDMQPN